MEQYRDSQGSDASKVSWSANLQTVTTPLDFLSILCKDTSMIKQTTSTLSNMTDAEFDAIIDAKIFHTVDRGDSMYNAINDVRPDLDADDWTDSMMMGIIEDIQYWPLHWGLLPLCSAHHYSHYSPILHSNYVQRRFHSPL